MRGTRGQAARPPVRGFGGRRQDDGEYARGRNRRNGEPRVTSFFIANLPDSITGEELWEECRNLGHIVDAFIPKKRDSSKGKFGFVRYANVRDIEKLETSLNGILIGGLKVSANVAKYDKYGQRSGGVEPRTWGAKNTTTHGTRKEVTSRRNYKPRPVGGVSFRDVLFHGWVRKFLDGKRKEHELLFSDLQIWDGQLIPFERIAWVHILGVPIQLWEDNTFNRIRQTFGEIVEFSATSFENGNMSYEEMGIIVDKPGRISTNINLEWGGQVFPVRIEETSCRWAPRCIKILKNNASSSSASAPAEGVFSEQGQHGVI
ncbi:hypothetical protein L1987_69479 [Smallanthus sonchifolius]|uniref:Uncharacterized protein n=1 Tax=Smallanthus sonchifolius TaxID=185202 RepID=A0ACB9B6K0_9ASTR|nr:hypothetical protein L1987_69479 [Smallanthus sonchifolius]